MIKLIERWQRRWAMRQRSWWCNYHVVESHRLGQLSASAPQLSLPYLFLRLFAHFFHSFLPLSASLFLCCRLMIEICKLSGSSLRIINSWLTAFWPVFGATLFSTAKRVGAAVWQLLKASTLTRLRQRLQLRLRSASFDTLKAIKPDTKRHDESRTQPT